MSKINVKAKTKLFPATGAIITNSIVKVDKEKNSYKVIKRVGEIVTIEYGNTELQVPINVCTLHKLYAVTKKIIAEVLYEDVPKLKPNTIYNFEMIPTHTRAKVGDVVSVYKFKLSNILSLNSIKGVIVNVNSKGSEYDIELADGTIVILKRHMFKKECDIKYYAKWIS